MRFNAGLLTFTLPYNTLSLGGAAELNLQSEGVIGGHLRRCRRRAAPVLAYFNTYLHALLCDLSVYIQGAFRVSFSLPDITEYVHRGVRLGFPHELFCSNYHCISNFTETHSVRTHK